MFVYVSDVEGVLQDGTEVNVKLPSERLHTNTPFEGAASESVDFVFEISVHKAGKSGKYILKPVASASGVDQPTDPVGRPGDVGPEAGQGDGGPPESGNETDGADGEAADAGGSAGQGDGDGGSPEGAGDGGPPADDGGSGRSGADEAKETTTTDG